MLGDISPLLGRRKEKREGNDNNHTRRRIPAYLHQRINPFDRVYSMGIWSVGDSSVNEGVD